MLERQLGKSLRRAIVSAEERRHKDTTEEHLLLALLDNPDARDALIGCGADLGRLRARLSEFIDHDGVEVAADGEHVAQPTGGFQRAVQHASITVDREGKDAITGADVLAELLAETDAYAVQPLNDQGVSRLDVSRYLSASRRQSGTSFD
ncbi:MAG TPA: Clp protease N-terminal domain-containing protein [Geminicoccaceae bacterium]|nr:Clp protease N-terminal domain-containing protein [Geminicoccaceae bacterium]